MGMHACWSQSLSPPQIQCSLDCVMKLNDLRPVQPFCSGFNWRCMLAEVRVHRLCNEINMMLNTELIKPVFPIRLIG